MTDSQRPTVVIITRDLMDGGRFRAARSDVVVVRTLEDERVERADIVILDLATGIAPAAATATGARVIAYGPHVDAEALDAAMRAGCEDAVPRSRIFHRIGELA